MPAYVRKQPLAERVKSALNIYDLLLWLSEEIESNGWDQLEKEWAIPIGFAFNFIFLIARANVGAQSSSYDDIFAETTGPGWTASIVCSPHVEIDCSLTFVQAWFLTHFLTLVCLLNTFYTFFRKRHYRLFETPVDTVPKTPSAHRVKLNSSPVSSSPLRFLSTILGSERAESRAHPDPKSDVWEIAVWDPLPVSLRLFCYFSPGHVILYWMFLPTLPADPRPSTTVITTIFLALLMSLQMSYMSTNFSQQQKDSALISKEVMHEYDTKYVRPRTQPLYRDVATQFTEEMSHSIARDEKYNNVVTFSPAFVINRGFKTNPNPNYVQQASSDEISKVVNTRPMASTPDFRSSMVRNDFSSPLRPQTAIRQPSFRPTAGVGDGGSLGVYSHAASPLKKSASTNFSPAKSKYIEDVARDRNGVSPEKRRSTPASGLVNTSAASSRWGHLKSDKARRETGHF